MSRRSTHVINDQTVRNAHPKAHRYEIRDSELRGFMLRVSPGGAKSWYVQLDRTHKRRIGDAHVLTASMARFRARDLLQRAEHLKRSGRGAEIPSLGHFLENRYGDWIDRKSRYGKRDCLRLKTALGDFAELRLNQFGVSQAERWKLVRAQRVSAATLNRELASLKAALNCAVRWKLIPDNPLHRVRLRRTSPVAEVRILQAAERKRLLAQLEDREDHIAIMVILALNTGMSRGELFRLRWKDVSYGINASLEINNRFGQHNRSRKIPLNIVAVNALKAWQSARRRKGTLVFPSPSGGRLKSIDTAWRKLMHDATITGFRFCDCRHDFAARLAMNGVPTSQITELLGHSSPALTARYARFAPGTARQAVEKLVQP